MEDILTKSTSAETMDVTQIVLRENSITRLVFRPKWVSTSSNPLRGGFCFQKKSKNETWFDFDSKSLSTFHKDEDYKLNLDGEEISKLLNELDIINKVLKECGHSYGERTILLNSDNVEGVFLQIGNQNNKDLVIRQLKKLESNNFENIGNIIGIAKLERAVEEFEQNLFNSSENFWQHFFEENAWILQQIFSYPVIWLSGETYLGGKSSKGRQGHGGVATDFLLQNKSHGSFAVVEIKTPETDLVGTLYRGDKNSDATNETYQIHGEVVWFKWRIRYLQLYSTFKVE